MAAERRQDRLNEPEIYRGRGSIQQPYQPPVTTQPPTGNYLQGDVLPQGQDDFWRGNIFERK